MRQARILSSAFLLFLLWWLLAVWMDNDFIIPYPLDVFEADGSAAAVCGILSEYTGDAASLMGRTIGGICNGPGLCIPILPHSCLS